MMRTKLFLLSSVSLAISAVPALAQEGQDAEAEDADVIVVTAQRSAQRLQDVPIAVSAFSAEALDKQQIENTSDLQLTLPNITFTKTNFTGSSFTIRGIGDLCVGNSCDQATAIHMNDAPLFSTRLFEGEFFDIGQIEVLRGPQGTLFGRNATSGVINIKTAKPDLSGFSMSAEAEYGNYDSMKVKGMVNVPLGETMAVRLAGYYLNRDGYTLNLFDGNRYDDRDQYAVRGSLRFEPTDSTTIELVGQYFHEKDNRMRIQKQLCQRDPTGVMGCLNGTRDYSTTNGNSTFVGVLTSREFLASQGIPTAFALGSLYGPDVYANAVNPTDPRVVNTDYAPTYETDEIIAQGHIDQDLGGGLKLKISGNYQRVRLESQQDYNLSVQNRALFAPALATLSAAAGGLVPGLPASYFSPIANALIPNGPTGNLCTSLAEETGTGAYGGHRMCSATPQDFDRSTLYNTSWSAEGIISSDFDGPINFLLGGIYGKYHVTEGSYYVNSFGIDYLTGVLGTFNALGRAGLGAIPGVSVPPPGYLATPFFRNMTNDTRLTSYGIFGEAYIKFNDSLKLTLGGRYNHDDKYGSARSTLANFLTPFNATDAFSSPYVYGFAPTAAPASARLTPFDADPKTACSISSTTASGILTPANLTGCELYAINDVTFTAWTGRAVLDWQITPDNLLYASYSRGYKSGGINPPLQPVFAVPSTFKPEYINAFEIGSKNTFADGKLMLNLTAFYYDYKDLQLSRIVARTSVNDNVNAEVWGLEAEAVIRPIREFTINIGASYLHTKVKQDKWLSNPRDFGGGRADAVIIKDITNGSNCAVSSTSGNVAGVNAFVNTINGAINAGAVPGLKAGAGLQNTTAFPSNGGLASTGAFGVCAVLQAAAGGAFAPAINPAAFGGIQFGSIDPLNPTLPPSPGINVNIKGNKLPQAPDFKFSVGAQYEWAIGDLTLTPRVDVAMTGEQTGNIFNGPVNAIDSYWQANAQIQLDGADKKWFVRAFVQNITDANSITGLYVTDQSSGNYTNIFTLEPRRYGIAAGIKF